MNIKNGLLIIIAILLLNGCVAVYTNNSLQLERRKNLYPVSFTRYLYDNNGNKVEVGTKQLKIIKHFEFIAQKDVETGGIESIDLTKKLDSLIQSAGGDGIVNFAISKPIIDGDSKGGMKLLLGQIGGSLLATVGLSYFLDKNSTNGTIFTIAGVGTWLATTFLMKDNVQVLIQGDVVKWAKN